MNATDEDIQQLDDFDSDIGILDWNQVLNVSEVEWQVTVVTQHSVSEHRWCDLPGVCRHRYDRWPNATRNVVSDDEPPRTDRDLVAGRALPKEPETFDRLHKRFGRALQPQPLWALNRLDPGR